MAHIVEISDLSAPELDVYARLTEAQLRGRQAPHGGLFVAESVTVIGHALDAGYEPVSFLMERKHAAGKAAALVNRCDVPVYTGDRAALSRLTGYELTRGVLCAMKRGPLPQVTEVCAEAGRLCVLEGVGDSANTGAIFRSAAALGVDAVLLAPGCCDPLCRRSVRVSMGTVFQVPWTCIGAKLWPSDFFELLRRLGFATAALALTDRAVPLDDPMLRARKKLALFLGSEGRGLAEATIEACDFAVRIPMSRGVDSLNVAAAGAVAFWQLRPNRE